MALVLFKLFVKILRPYLVGGLQFHRSIVRFLPANSRWTRVRILGDEILVRPCHTIKRVLPVFSFLYRVDGKGHRTRNMSDLSTKLTMRAPNCKI
jgi:hypothetical protein